MPLARARADLDDRDLAIASASHRATDDQIAAVRALLAKAPATEDDLELGLQEGRPPQKIFHNCSGKHAGMLALCRANGWPTVGLPPARPSGPAGLPPPRTPKPSKPATKSSRPASTAAASSRSRFRSSAWPTRSRASNGCRKASRIADAMRAHPDLVGGPDGVDFHLMRAAPGWFAKGGAEGLLCAGGPNGLGIALKSEDGAGRPLGPALAAFLGPLRRRVARTSRRIPVDVDPRRPRRRARRPDFVTPRTFLYEPVTHD